MNPLQQAMATAAMEGLKRNRITQTQLAREIGASPVQISRILRGVITTGSVELWNKVLVHLGVHYIVLQLPEGRRKNGR